MQALKKDQQNVEEEKKKKGSSVLYVDDQMQFNKRNANSPY